MAEGESTIAVPVPVEDDEKARLFFYVSSWKDENGVETQIQCPLPCLAPISLLKRVFPGVDPKEWVTLDGVNPGIQFPHGTEGLNFGSHLDEDDKDTVTMSFVGDNFELVLPHGLGPGFQQSDNFPGVFFGADTDNNNALMSQGDILPLVDFQSSEYSDPLWTCPGPTAIANGTFDYNALSPPSSTLLQDLDDCSQILKMEPFSLPLPDPDLEKLMSDPFLFEDSNQSQSLSTPDYCSRSIENMRAGFMKNEWDPGSPPQFPPPFSSLLCHELVSPETTNDSGLNPSPTEKKTDLMNVNLCILFPKEEPKPSESKSKRWVPSSPPSQNTRTKKPRARTITTATATVASGKLETATEANHWLCPSPGCDLRFKQRSMMTRHYAIHGPTHPCPFPPCPASFLTRTGLARHRLIKHIDASTVKISKKKKPSTCAVKVKKEKKKR